MLQIPIKHDDAHSCLDDIVVAISNWYGRDHELMFSESWEFKFIKPKEPHNTIIGKYILPKENRRHELSGIHHGLELTFHNIESVDQLIQAIKDELAGGRPISVYIDTFWCPWYKEGFQEFHYSHYCIILDYDEPKGILYCIDGQMANTPVELPIEMLKKGYGNYITFSLLRDDVYDFDWKKIIANSIENIGLFNEGSDMFSNMIEFSNYLNENLDINQEIQGFEKFPLLAPIFQQLFRVSRGRKQFAKTLRYIGEKRSIIELIGISDKMKRAGDTWSSIFGMLVKSMYIENPEQIIERISRKIIDMSGFEKSIAVDLNKISSGTYVPELSNLTEKNDKNFDTIPTNYYYVKLESYFNNQGFSMDMTQNGKAEFSNSGRFFFADGLPERSDWNVGNMKFSFPRISEGNYDNLSCAGQKISISSKNIFNSIMFLGCAEIGNHSEEVQLEYGDGTSEFVNIEFTSWLISKPTFEEHIAWSGKAAVRSNNSVDLYPFPVQIFAEAYQLISKKVIKSIIMPQCPNIHVFSISLGA